MKAQMYLLDNGVTLFFILVLVLISALVMYNFDNQLDTQEQFNITALDGVKTFTGGFSQLLDFLIPSLMVIFTIISVIATRSSLLDKFGLAVRVIIVIFTFPLFLIIAYACQFVAELVIFQNITAQMTITPFFISYLPIFGALYTFIMLVALISQQ